MKRPALALGLALCVSLCFPAIAPEFVAADPVTQSIKCATPEQIDAFDAQHRLLAVSEIVTPESICKTQERATSSDDFLPREVAEKPMPAPELITSTAGEVTQIERLARNGYRASVKLRKPGRIELHQFQFPGWRATLDGGPVETFASGRSALVGCDAPAGDHVVEFSYSAMPQRRAGLAIAGISLLTAVAILSLGKASTAIGDFS